MVPQIIRRALRLCRLCRRAYAVSKGICYYCERGL
jgi:hypothetical protein